MPETKVLPVTWTGRALENAISIKKYLLRIFSEKEVDNFFSLVHSFEIAVSVFPKMYPASNKTKAIRRAVLSKELSAFYRIHKSKIEVLAFLDNRIDVTQYP